MTTGDGSNPGDDLDGDPGSDRDDDVIERLRRLDPVDVESLPSSRRAEAMRTLEAILGPEDDTEPS
ncbi:MAG: hypothetical protein F4Y12_05075 [Acidimicrobiaceae bacterium]|nr:hypothetical protein [Acidimicrobiaceae bacterium]MYA84938.1 hypothetical protein [Acidimicrobiaceae bacterium]MYE09095.1 hypothetical protein [Acidimicrobiaceae bacterium]MYH76983.1 hypothetical protein [Acidimicrobiaceae bacterium]MYI35426.1 hypothetical protein [Acidimicrobiaceae bacterium]